MGELVRALLDGHDGMKMKKDSRNSHRDCPSQESGVILKFVAKGEDLKLSGAILQFIPGFRGDAGLTTGPFGDLQYPNQERSANFVLFYKPDLWPGLV